jgi:hypothetical protein
MLLMHQLGGVVALQMRGPHCTRLNVIPSAMKAVVRQGFSLAEILFCRSACLYGQKGGGQSRRQTVQLGQNFKGRQNKSSCS